MEEDAARIVRQLLSAVAYMHDRGVVHRGEMVYLRNILS